MSLGQEICDTDRMTPEPADRELIELLRQRDGWSTIVTLRDGAELTVFNIAWGYDDSDAYSHITTNVSPSLDGAVVDHFFGSDVVMVRDASCGEIQRAHFAGDTHHIGRCEKPVVISLPPMCIWCNRSSGSV